MMQRDQAAFTLMELVVMVAVIAVLLGLLVMAATDYNQMCDNSDPGIDMFDTVPASELARRRVQFPVLRRRRPLRDADRARRSLPGPLNPGRWSSRGV